MSARFSFFIAHASPDEPWARQLYDALQPEPCFLDSVSLGGGTRWPKAIVRAQAESRATVALVSKHADDAWFFQDEVLRAIDLLRHERHRVFPVYLEGLPRRSTDVPYGLYQLQGLDGLRGPEAVADELEAQLGDVPESPVGPAPAPGPRGVRPGGGVRGARPAGSGAAHGAHVVGLNGGLRSAPPRPVGPRGRPRTLPPRTHGLRPPGALNGGPRPAGVRPAGGHPRPAPPPTPVLLPSPAALYEAARQRPLPELLRLATDTLKADPTRLRTGSASQLAADLVLWAREEPLRALTLAAALRRPAR